MVKEPRKIIEYTDELNDDFASNKIKEIPIDVNFKYIRKSFFYNVGSFLLTYFIAVPVLGVYLQAKFGLRVKNRKVLRKVRGQAFFLYGNHTQGADAFIPQAAVNWSRKTFIVANPAATSIPGIKIIVQMLGAVPVPDPTKDLGTVKNFISALDYYVKKRRCIAIYPEAHIWPYYTGVRPFKSNSFRYPVQYKTPAVAMVVTYRKRKYRKTPRIILTLSEVFYPDTTLSAPQAKEKLRNEVYDFMVSHANNPDNYAYYEYRKKQ